MNRRFLGSLACGVSICLTLMALPASARSYSFRVKHTHTVGGCEGTLRISENDIRYDTDERADARIWLYPQIKKIERKGMRTLVIYTYEDQRLRLGRDKPFEFELLDGEVSDEVFNFVIVRVGQAGDRPPPAPPPGGRYELVARHEHSFGGCDGTLKITDTHIEFVSANPDHARLWKYLDIKHLRQSSTYHLSIVMYENQLLKFGRSKTFNFQLKEPLEPYMFEFMQQRLRAGP